MYLCLNNYHCNLNSKFNHLFHSLNVLECTRGCQYISVTLYLLQIYISRKPLFKGQSPVNLTPTPLSSYVQNSSNPLNLGCPISNQLPLPLQIITNQLTENLIQGWLLHIIRSFLQVGFCSQYQLINLAWLSIDSYPFSWSQPRPHTCFKKIKTFFSSSAYRKKMYWGQGWAEASLSALLWL